MKLDLNAIKNKLLIETIPYKGDNMSSGKKLPSLLDEIFNKIGKCAREEDSDELLNYMSSINDELIKHSGTSYKYKDYYIDAMFSYYANSRINTLQKLNDANIHMAPELVALTKKDGTEYLFTRISGTENGELIPFEKGYHLLSDEAKRDAYRDIQKILKLGIDNVAMNRSTSVWFITPENPRVVVQHWNNIRSLDNYDNQQELLNMYYRKLFRK